MGSPSDTSSPRRDLRPQSAQVVRARFEQAVGRRLRSVDESLRLTVCRPEFDHRSTAEDTRTTPLVLQYDTTDSCARLWLKCPKPSGVGIETQILRVAGLGLPVRMARTADGDDRDKRGDDRHNFSTAALGRSRPAIYGRATSSPPVTFPHAGPAGRVSRVLGD
jgi:hypothetical protein